MKDVRGFEGESERCGGREQDEVKVDRIKVVTVKGGRYLAVAIQ